MKAQYLDKEEIDNDSIILELLLCIYPGMVKDIGDLTLRVDNLETAFKSLKEEVNGISITAENGTIYSLKVKREL